MLKKNQLVEAVIDEVQFPNKAMATVNGTRIAIKGGLPGQKVLARITKTRKATVEADIEQVLEKSSIEKPSGCEHFENCGGCAYQHLPYNEQLKMKENQVKQLLDEGGITGFEFQGIEASPVEAAYRNKMEFSFGDLAKGGDLALGLHKKGGFYEVVTVSGCRIVDEDFGAILLTVQEYFREKGIAYYNKKHHEGVLRHLVVRKAIKTGELLVNLVTSSQMQLELSGLLDRLLKLDLSGQLKGFLHTLNDSVADVVKSDETRILFGQDFIMEEILGLKFRISAFSFFQTNSLGAEKLYSMVRDFAGCTNEKVIFDLYCGTGTIAQIMAPQAEKVIGIEIVEEAVEAARENAAINGLGNCTFIAGDVLKKVDELDIKPDLIILDPPRDGVHPKALEKIIQFGSPEIVYVSCKPTSLVRDLQLLTARGYVVDKVKCMDMFPHTPHVECVCLLKRV